MAISLADLMSACFFRSFSWVLFAQWCLLHQALATPKPLTYSTKAEQD